MILTNRPLTDGDADIRGAIEMATMCEFYHVLPDAGGLLDQDPFNIRIMQIVAAARNERREMDQQRSKQQANKH